MTPNNIEKASGEESSRESKRAASASPQREQGYHQPQQLVEVLKCPRCDSMKTKFCYYNNYNLAQPRHFCKTCRRYWTKGGALRNVPIGGGCRKNKRLKASSSNASMENSSISTSPDLGELKFLDGLSSFPAMDFQFGGMSLPKLNLTSPPSSGTVFNQFANSFGDIVGSSLPIPSPSCLSSDNPSLGFNLSLSSLFKQQSGNNGSLGLDGNQELGYVGNNQDFPLKFQQTKFVDMVSGNDNMYNINQNKNDVSQSSYPPFLEIQHQTQKPEASPVQNFGISSRTTEVYYGDHLRKEGLNGNFASGYFLDETFLPTINPTTSTITSIGANDGNEIGSNWNNGSQAWGNFDQFGGLP